MGSEGNDAPEGSCYMFVATKNKQMPLSRFCIDILYWPDHDGVLGSQAAIGSFGFEEGSVVVALTMDKEDTMSSIGERLLVAIYNKNKEYSQVYFSLDLSVVPVPQ